MSEALKLFEKIARGAKNVGQPSASENRSVHPFDERNIHPEITSVSLKLFDNGHYSQATFEAFKYLDIQVKKLSGINDSGYKLMMAAFAEASPKIKLTNLATSSDIDEQMGFKFIFAGVMSAIRNPRGHDITSDPIDRCLDHLSVASVLLRRIEERIEPQP
ncbi:TIGR02391 family protein [Inquilinus limosus]|uniref:TIGR02391 family protein n=1 Tax=Inquilinus limosus TaxID=171674 RepID=A0A211ZT72_9PROT|nr:TIGR02391 family protein [Inquilinus limosus]OWJ68470.1 TIGR02391 family protein [Inquilinus limosus]